MLVYDDALLREPNLWIPGKKPIGPVKIDWSHPLANKLECYLLFNERSGNRLHDVAKGLTADILWTGDDTTYYEWSPTGLKNSSYDGDFNDGAGIRINSTKNISYGPWILGWSELYTGGNFTSSACGICDWMYTSGAADPSGYLAYNKFGTVNTALIATVGNQSLTTSSGARLTTVGEVHTYVAAAWQGTSNAHIRIYRDGQLIDSSDSLTKATYERTAPWFIGVHDSVHHNRGFNSELRSAFIYIGIANLEVAKQMSIDPYQFLVPV